jgi:hypothetical protein
MGFGSENTGNSKECGDATLDQRVERRNEAMTEEIESEQSRTCVGTKQGRRKLTHNEAKHVGVKEQLSEQGDKHLDEVMTKT